MPMRQLLISAIGLYQRVLSPRKGYRCAYHHHTGRASCSHLGYRAVRRLGVWRGLLVLRRRLARCAAVYQQQAQPLAAMRWQRGALHIDCAAGAQPRSCGAGAGTADAGGCAGACQPQANCAPFFGARRRQRQSGKIPGPEGAAPTLVR